MKILLPSVVILVVMTTKTFADEPCSMNSDIEWTRDETDCSTAYTCLFGRRVTYACPEGHVIGARSRYCVPIGSELDDCTDKKIDKIHRNVYVSTNCKLGDVSADDNNCAKYFECVATSSGNTTMLGKECPYPQLFDTESGKCDVYSNVKCMEDQFVPKNPCDYDVNKCTTSHCIPCDIRYPSCTGLPDGVHPWTGREWSPYYIVCAEERVTLQGQCKSEKNTQVFHPEKRVCMEFDEKDLIG